MNEVYLLLGSNAGNRLQLLANAVQQIKNTCGPAQKISSIYQTAAWGLEDQPNFLNMVVLIDTSLSPVALLQVTQQIENNLGRQRTVKWGQRTLDIDILLYNSVAISLPHLKIPHPFLQQRRFTLVPLAEIAGGYIHPVLNTTINQLLLACDDKLEVEKTDMQLPLVEK